MQDARFKSIPSAMQPDVTLLERISKLGITIGMNVTLRGPEYYYSSYPQGFQDDYTRKNYIFLDPMVAWAMTHLGWKRWSAVSKLESMAPVFKAAKSYGLTYGATLAISTNDKRSMASLARSDREFEDGELDLAASILERLSEVSYGSRLTIEETEALRMVSLGMAQKGIAAELGVAEITVRTRLSRAKDKLGAETVAHAVRIATETKQF